MNFTAKNTLCENSSKMHFLKARLTQVHFSKENALGKRYGLNTGQIFNCQRKYFHKHKKP